MAIIKAFLFVIAMIAGDVVFASCSSGCNTTGCCCSTQSDCDRGYVCDEGGASKSTGGYEGMAGQCLPVKNLPNGSPCNGGNNSECSSGACCKAGTYNYVPYYECQSSC